MTSKVNKSKVCRKHNLDIKSMSLSSSSGNMLKCKVDGSRFAKDEVGIERLLKSTSPQLLRSSCKITTV